MRQPEFVIDIFLSPGEFFFGDADTRIRTILGSCVSITVWHPKKRIGGMCHYMLPTRTKGVSQANEHIDDGGRYADEAMAKFLKEIKNHGTKPSEYQAKIFGGGNMLGKNGIKSQFAVGDRNIKAGNSLLEKHGFNVIAEHMGGAFHRQVLFEVWSGNVWLKRHAAMGLEEAARTLQK